jgi:hypothetical protein
MDKQKLTVLQGEEDPDDPADGKGEGLAMAEIIHALAPDAHIVFATGYDTPARMASNIKKLAAEGCKIIVDDITYSNESPFQDGPIGRAVQEVSSHIQEFSISRLPETLETRSTAPRVCGKETLMMAVPLYHRSGPPLVEAASMSLMTRDA